MARSLVEITLPNGGNVAWLVPWMDLERQPPLELLRPLAELIPDGVWTARLIPDDESDRRALTGY